jgi:plasmid stabilization system protein ParE
VTVLFGWEVLEVFENLPDRVKERAGRSINLLSSHPKMYPIRRRGLMEEYRYFVVERYLFYYSVTSSEIRISAILPGSMRQA